MDLPAGLMFLHKEGIDCNFQAAFSTFCCSLQQKRVSFGILCHIV